MHTLFAYGTLQLPQVMLAVTGHAFSSQPARLHDYSRHRLRDRSFPGIRPNSGAVVEGTVFFGIDAESLKRLDEFEDSFYRREAVQVVGTEGGERMAQAYIVREEAYGLLLPEEWSLEEFEHQHMQRFLHSHE